MRSRLGRSAALAAALLLATAAKPVPTVVQGVFALAGGHPKVAATLYATPVGALSQDQPGVPTILGVTMTAPGARKPVASYEPELGKAAHIIAISHDFRDFTHVHSDAVEKGRLNAPITFPHSGFYHVYADAAPLGIGQQVFRFELRVGTARGAAAPAQPEPLPAPSLDAADGPYAARFAPFTLRAGQDAVLRLTLLRDGQPAPDVTPYLGVAAHAVFISTETLSYTHVHAIPASAAGASTAAMPGMADPPPLTGAVPPELALRVTPPSPGVYRLWVQFMAGGAVRTAAFTVLVQ